MEVMVATELSLLPVQFMEAAAKVVTARIQMMILTRLPELATAAKEVILQQEAVLEVTGEMVANHLWGQSNFPT